MARYVEWDFDNPKHWQRRRRPPPILDGEILEPEVEPEQPRIRVEVTHRYQPPQRRSAPPPWIVPLVVILFFSMVSPYALCVQPVSATPLAVYRLAFGSPRSFADVD